LAWWPESCWAALAVVGCIGLVPRTVLGGVGLVAHVDLVGVLLGCAWSTSPARAEGSGTRH
jgi:hypothetical protein